MANIFNKLIWSILNKPYFEVIVLSHGRKIKTFYQLAASKDKGEDSFLRCKQLKMSWWKPSKPILDGVKFLVMVDLKNAIPLEIEEDIDYDDKGLYIKETKTLVIKEDIEKQRKIQKNGNPLKTVEVSIIPTLLHEIVEAHLVKEIMSSPKDDKMESLKWIFICGIIVFGIIIGIYLLRG